MTFRHALVSGFEALREPRQAQLRALEEPIEDALGNHMRRVLTAGVAAGLFSLIFSVAQALYLQQIKHVDIAFGRLLNYYSGIAFGTFLFYVFAGTFLLFLLSVVIRLFVRQVPFWTLIKLLCIAMVPVLLFGWIGRGVALALLVWSAFLLVSGILTVRSASSAKRTPSKKRSR